MIIKSACSLTINPFYHAWTKHIELGIHFVKDKILEKTLEIRYVPSCDQIVDKLTKAITLTQFHFLTNKLGVVTPPLSFKVGC